MKYNTSRSYNQRDKPNNSKINPKIQTKVSSRINNKSLEYISNRKILAD